MNLMKHIQEAYAYHRNFSSFQKIILLTGFLALLAGLSTNLLICFLIYIIVVVTTILVCQYLISSKHNFTLLLRTYKFYKKHKHVIDNTLELQTTIMEVSGLWEPDNNKSQEQNKIEEELFYDATDKQSPLEQQSDDASKQIPIKWEDEVDICTQLIQKHFIDIWLRDFNPHNDFITEFDKVLRNGLKNLVNSIKAVDINVLVKEISLIGRQHIKTLQISRDKYKTQPRRRSSSSRRDSLTHLSPKRKLSSVEDAFEMHSTYHIGLYGDENEQHYLLSVCDILLSKTFGDILQNCIVSNCVLSEILMNNVLLPVVDLLTEPDFIYEKMILILSEESLEIPFDEEDFPMAIIKESVLDGESTGKEVENFCDVYSDDFQESQSGKEIVSSQLNVEKDFKNSHGSIPQETEGIPDVPLTLINFAHRVNPSESNSNSSQTNQDDASLKQEKAMLKDVKPEFFLSCAEDEQDSTTTSSTVEQQDVYMNSLEVIEPKPLIFQDLSMNEYEIRKESRSSSQFVLYTIQYHALYWVDDNKDPVLRTMEAKRRHREFVNLHARLEDNPAYKKCLKDVIGPKRWKTFPFGNFNKKTIEERQKSLEKYLKSLILIEEVCNGPELSEFLAYEGDGHIAFVRKSPELNVPRIDKMIVKTMSGVFDEIVKLPSRVSFPSLPGKREPSKESDKEDGDQITVEFDIDSKCESQEELLEHFIVVCDDTCCLMEGFPGKPIQNKQENESDEDISLAEAMVDIGVQTLQGKDNWVCRERVISVTKHLIGIILDRWLKDQIADLASQERCVSYLQLLRETVWPEGELFDGGRSVKTDRQKAATKEQARKCLTQFFPDALRQLIGTEDFDHAINEVIESLQYKKLNRHLLYTLLDSLLELMYPDIQPRKSSV